MSRSSAQPGYAVSPGLFASFRHRVQIPELMDEPGIDPADHRAALIGLARINRLSRSAEVLWPSLAALARSQPIRPLRILDVATGSGDVPIRLARMAQRIGLHNLQFLGCDISQTAIQAARDNAARAAARIEFFQQDILRDPLPDRYDVVMCSLFLHHLSEVDALTLLGRMHEQASGMVLVNDLARSRLSCVLVWAACHLLSRSRIVRFDGPASVRSAFSPREVLALAEQAGLIGATSEKRFPCRFLLSWSRRTES